MILSINAEHQPQFRPTKSPEEQPVSDDIVTLPNGVTVAGAMLSLYGITSMPTPSRAWQH